MVCTLGLLCRIALAGSVVAGSSVELECQTEGDEVSALQISVVSSGACCKANNAECLACSKGVSVEEYCTEHNPTSHGLYVPGCEGLQKMCCDVLVAECLACHKGVSVKEWCLTQAQDGFPGAPGCEDFQPKFCCKANTAICLACSKGVSVEEYCTEHAPTPHGAYVPGCEDFKPKPMPDPCCYAYHCKKNDRGCHKAWHKASKKAKCTEECPIPMEIPHKCCGCNKLKTKAKKKCRRGCRKVEFQCFQPRKTA